MRHRKEGALYTYAEKLGTRENDDKEVKGDGNVRFLGRVLSAIKLEIDGCLMFNGIEPERGRPGRAQRGEVR